MLRETLSVPEVIKVVVLEADRRNPVQVRIGAAFKDLVFGAFAIHLQQIDGVQVLVGEYQREGCAVNHLPALTAGRHVE